MNDFVFFLDGGNKEVETKRIEHYKEWAGPFLIKIEQPPFIYYHPHVNNVAILTDQLKSQKELEMK